MGKYHLSGIKWFLFWLILWMLFSVGVVYAQNHAAAPYTITASTSETAPGQEVVVSYIASPEWSSDAWIGLIPADTPRGDQKIADKKDIDYQYLNRSPAGNMTFLMPEVPGFYEFRLFPSDDDTYPEVAVSEPILVKASLTPSIQSQESPIPLSSTTIDILPSFPETEPVAPTLPGMGQVVTALPSPSPTLIPTLSDILIVPLQTPIIDQLPILTPLPSLEPVDTEPPMVVTTEPSSGAIEIPLNTTIRIQFNETIYPGNAYDFITVQDANQKLIAIEKGIQNKELTLKPKNDLNPDTIYQVVLPLGSLKDSTGNPLMETLVFSFTTIVPLPVSMFSLPFVGGKPQDIIDIPIHFNGYQKMIRAEMVFSFDPNLLEYLGIVHGEINAEWLTSAKILEPGRVSIAIIQANHQMLTKESGTIAVVKFQVLKEPKGITQSDLDLEQLQLFDNKERLLQGEVMSGMFNLVGTDTVSSSPAIETPALSLEPSALDNGKTEEEYIFKASLGNFPDTVKAIKYLWNFGDGSKVTDSSEGEMKHIYSKPGKFELTVKVFDISSGEMIAMQKMMVTIKTSIMPSPEINPVSSDQAVQTYREKYANGKLKIQYTYIIRLDGTWLKNGIETTWFENGKKKTEGEYQNGKKVGTWISWYENGVIGQKGTYQNDKKEGLWTKYYRNGNKGSEGYYRDNQRDGKWKKWYEDGRLWAEFECQKDQIIPGTYKEYQ